MLQKQLKEMTSGLYYMSESDYPLDVMKGTGKAATTQDVAALFHAMKPSATDAVRVSIDDFFKNATRKEDWMGEEERAAAAQFQALVDYLNACKEAAVFRVGEVKIECFIVAKTQQDEPIFIKTITVET